MDGQITPKDPLGAQKCHDMDGTCLLRAGQFLIQLVRLIGWTEPFGM